MGKSDDVIGVQQRQRAQRQRTETAQSARNLHVRFVGRCLLLGCLLELLLLFLDLFQIVGGWVGIIH